MKYTDDDRDSEVDGSAQASAFWDCLLLADLLDATERHDPRAAGSVFGLI
jgi:hypothetical protein